MCALSGGSDRNFAAALENFWEYFQCSGSVEVAVLQRQLWRGNFAKTTLKRQPLRDNFEEAALQRQLWRDNFEEATLKRQLYKGSFERQLTKAALKRQLCKGGLCKSTKKWSDTKIIPAWPQPNSFFYCFLSTHQAKIWWEKKRPKNKTNCKSRVVERNG